MYKLMECNGLTNYKDGLKMQQTAFEKVYNEQYKGILIILEHYPVYTIGTGGGWENLLCSKEYLKEQGVDIVEINRGGNITFHGPGQVVAYPIFDLSKMKRDAHWYIESLEQIVINVLSEYGIEGARKPEYKGVWIDDKKISAVGVHLKRWITSHGLSFNINVDKKYFNQINPCGITEFGIASLEDYMEDVDIASIKQHLVKNFEKVFDIQFDAYIGQGERTDE
ncbi:lipoyl(octanoyl) transferase LipB [Clostridium aminobutyricum]|uniref:Octanoyltransferase n=1 Tax=Clostridium aminobutyricum TaxID=33953 RepID=A0A939IJ06_CLOAM|nr:lipoyl(octanoyl) transferase LipB [Clostridium aminobutyricum]MBN7773113.1 lipoyl(octanoyl) transferase LipB [Clostridium aminobutyricum]